MGQVETNSKNRIGIKTSINTSSIRGTEFENPRLKFGYTAGAFYQQYLNENWNFYTEFVGNFKGSNFKNDIDEYNRVSLFYIDVPLMLMYNLDDDKKQSVLLGPYASYLALSAVYVGSQRKAELSNIALKPFDFGIAGFYQLNGKFTTLQVGAKIGLYNINNGVNFEDITPETGKNGTISNLGIEIGMLF
ncbi:MAG: PorT family protein [Bacteroidia bacterium]|nr:PorT family protein [Bacteroidia bacterium]